MKDFFKQSAFDSGCKEDFDFTKPFAVVTAYKEFGKWYTTHYVHLTEEHINLINSNMSFKIVETIKRVMLGGSIEPTVEYLCPLNNWKNLPIYQFKAYGCDGFCDYLIMYRGLDV